MAASDAAGTRWTGLAGVWAVGRSRIGDRVGDLLSAHASPATPALP